MRQGEASENSPRGKLKIRVVRVTPWQRGKKYNKSRKTESQMKKKVYERDFETFKKKGINKNVKFRQIERREIKG
jgi:uncharacterized protein YxeA